MSPAPHLAPNAVSEGRLSYRPQLDGLRAFAVAAVVVQHGMPSLGKAFPFAHAGVRLFFVLSGYLITSLLLSLRDREGLGRGRALGEFYTRRALRIWPLYFFVIAVGLALDAGPVREVLPWLLTHTVNFCLVAQGVWIDTWFHFWTLSVEEQFYLVWPLVVLFAPRRWLAPATLLLILTGPAYRAVAVDQGWKVVTIFCPTPACFDTLGFGSLVAILGHHPGRRQVVDRALGRGALPAGVLAVVLLRVLHGRGVEWPQDVFFDVGLALVFGWLVRGAAVGFRGLPRLLLEAPPVVYVGKISYGIYVYHVLVPYFFASAMLLVYPEWFSGQDVRSWLNIVIVGGSLVVLPVLSWHFLEKPINDLKDLVGRPRREASPAYARRRRKGYAALAACAAVILGVAGFEGWSAWQAHLNRQRTEQLADAGSEAAAGVVYHVSPAGDDAGAGTSPEAPWRSLDRVSRASFGPGDRVLLEGGQSFAGTLRFERGGGTPANPVVVGSYGTGRATLRAGDGPGIVVRNVAGFRIENLAVVGSGRQTNRGSGILFKNDLRGDVKLPGISVDGVEVSGFGHYGIAVEGLQGKSGYRGVRIERAEAFDNALAGICVSGKFSERAKGHAHRDVAIRLCKAHDNPGLAGKQREHSGSGIILSDVDGGVIERCLAWENGRLCDSKKGGPFGIWAWDAARVVIQHNEAYRNRTGGTKDGGGFDLDGGVTDSVLQYNYSHDNDGPGFMLCQFDGARPFARNTIRYNVSQNDARKNPYGAIHLHDDCFANGIRVGQIYHNTAYLDHSPTREAVAFVSQRRAAGGVSVRNNIFHSAGGAALVEVHSGQEQLRLEGNSYYAAAASLTIVWDGVRYSGLPAWRKATGQERLDGRDVGSDLDPRLEAPGKGGTLADAAKLASLTAYRLKPFSPLLRREVTSTCLVNDPGLTDYYGHALPTGAALPAGAHCPPANPTAEAILGRWEGRNERGMKEGFEFAPDGVVRVQWEKQPVLPGKYRFDTLDTVALRFSLLYAFKARVQVAGDKMILHPLEAEGGGDRVYRRVGAFSFTGAPAKGGR
jgi:peptidoglycan/LPS O-acetylase OafA/YrhL